MTIAQVYAPWTEEQVRALNTYQRDDRFHPYTCPTRRCRAQKNEGRLRATESGWVCGLCGYTQAWAHASSIRMGQEATGQ
jgi:hypothetical protein